MAIESFFQNPLYTGILGALGGIIGTLATKFGEGWITEFYDKQKQARIEKKQAAKDITSFCIEGMHKGFRIKAGSEHAIKFRAAEIEAIDVDVGKKLLDFIGAWGMYRVIMRERHSIEEEKLAIEYKNKAQNLGDELLEIARKWAK